MIERKSWDDFRESGMLWFINTILHAFGWAICISLNEGGTVDLVCPARVKFRGFEQEVNDVGYKKVAQYLKENAGNIYGDAMKG